MAGNSRSTLRIVGLGAATLLAFSIPVGGHEVGYVNWNVGTPYDVALTQSCPPGSIDNWLGTEQRQYGGVLYCAYHIEPDADGPATVAIYDDLSYPVSGTVCSVETDSVLDGCVEGTVQRFCGSVELGSRAHWDSWRHLVVFVDGPANGNLNSSPCGVGLGEAPYTGGTRGYVTHS